MASLELPGSPFEACFPEALLLGGLRLASRVEVASTWKSLKSPLFLPLLNYIMLQGA